jgi:hypothetical protein
LEDWAGVVFAKAEAGDGKLIRCRGSLTCKPIDVSLPGFEIGLSGKKLWLRALQTFLRDSQGQSIEIHGILGRQTRNAIDAYRGNADSIDTIDIAPIKELLKAAGLQTDAAQGFGTLTRASLLEYQGRLNIRLLSPPVIERLSAQTR